MRRKPAHTNPRKTIEWSKFLASAIAGLFGVFGVWATIRYYQLVEIAITTQAAVTPDPTVAVTCITTVLASLMSYLLYQAGLKNSRNKYGVDSDGQPFKQKTEFQSVDDDAEG